MKNYSRQFSKLIRLHHEPDVILSTADTIVARGNPTNIDKPVIERIYKKAPHRIHFLGKMYSGNAYTCEAICAIDMSQYEVIAMMPNWVLTKTIVLWKKEQTVISLLKSFEIALI